MNKAVQIRKVRVGDEQALAYVQTESWKAALRKSFLPICFQNARSLSAPPPCISAF